MELDSQEKQNKKKIFFRYLLLILVALGLSVLLPMPLNPWAVYYMTSQYEEDGVTLRKTREQIEEENKRAELRAAQTAQQVLESRRYRISPNSILPTGEIYKVFESHDESQPGYWIWGTENGKLGVIAVNKELQLVESVTNKLTDIAGGVGRGAWSLWADTNISLLLLGDFYSFPQNGVVGQNSRILAVSKEGSPEFLKPTVVDAKITPDFFINHILNNPNLVDAYTQEFIIAFPSQGGERISKGTESRPRTSRDYSLYSLNSKGEIRPEIVSGALSLQDLKRIKSFPNHGLLVEGLIEFSQSKGLVQSWEKFQFGILKKTKSLSWELDPVKTRLLNKHFEFSEKREFNGLSFKTAFNTHKEASTVLATVNPQFETRDYFYRGILVARAHSLRTEVRIVDSFDPKFAPEVISILLPAASLPAFRKQLVIWNDEELGVDDGISWTDRMPVSPRQCFTRESLQKPIVEFGKPDFQPVELNYLNPNQWALSGEFWGATVLRSKSPSNPGHQKIDLQKNDISLFKKDFSASEYAQILLTGFKEIDSLFENSRQKLKMCDSEGVSALQPGFSVIETEIRGGDGFKQMAVLKNLKNSNSETRLISVDLFEIPQFGDGPKVRNIRFINDQSVWMTGKFKSKTGDRINSWVDP